jgi:hypothetical protein
MSLPEESVFQDLQVRMANMEFVMQVIFANALSRMSEDASETLKSAMLDCRAHLPRRTGPVAVKELEAFRAHSAAELRHFLTKVADWETQIRASHKQDSTTSMA